jgi:hypothetical protein
MLRTKSPIPDVIIVNGFHIHSAIISEPSNHIFSQILNTCTNEYNENAEIILPFDKKIVDKLINIAYDESLPNKTDILSWFFFCTRHKLRAIKIPSKHNNKTILK